MGWLVFAPDGVSRFILKLSQTVLVDRLGLVLTPSGIKYSELLRVDSRDISTLRTVLLLAQCPD